jgi:hypothetical protein
VGFETEETFPEANLLVKVRANGAGTTPYNHGLLVTAARTHIGGATPSLFVKKETTNETLPKDALSS